MTVTWSPKVDGGELLVVGGGNRRGGTRGGGVSAVKELQEEARQYRLVFRNMVPPILIAMEVGDARDIGDNDSPCSEKNESHSLDKVPKSN